MSEIKSPWTAVAERSGDTALAGAEDNQAIARSKAAWHFISRRSP